MGMKVPITKRMASPPNAMTWPFAVLSWFASSQRKRRESMMIVMRSTGGRKDRVDGGEIPVSPTVAAIGMKARDRRSDGDQGIGWGFGSVRRSQGELIKMAMAILLTQSFILVGCFVRRRVEKATAANPK